jgi:selenocysteine lyase/cysteine desulfurase
MEKQAHSFAPLKNEIAMYKQHYQRFLSATDRLHFAAHSHHLWPDCTRDAVLSCWDDAARYADDKWDYLFESVISEAQGHVARLLKSDQPEQIVFAPNTQEFVVRLFSCFPRTRPVRILTSDAEFHSFSRQVRSWEHHRMAEVTRIPSHPADTFVQRVAEQATKTDFDIIFFSHVFFDSGLCVGDISPVIAAANSQSMIAIDAYHSFAALPLDIRACADRVFWLGGGYKYAQSGEGVCWLHVPRSHQTNPTNTGWYAAFGSLSHSAAGLPFANDGRKFAGATFDPTGIYRFNAVMQWLTKIELTIEQVHAYVVSLQRHFLQQVDSLGSTVLSRQRLICETLDQHGHFLTFEMADEPTSAEVNRQLRERNVIIDYRGNRLRFGFGLYQDETDIDLLFDRLRDCPAVA